MVHFLDQKLGVDLDIGALSGLVEALIPASGLSSPFAFSSCEVLFP